MEKYKITEEQLQKIKNEIKEYEKTTSFRKLQAVMLMGEGTDVHKVASITLYHYKHVYVLVKQFCLQGFEEFVKEKRGGAHHRNMTEAQETELLGKFREKAESGQIVSLQVIKEEYENVQGKKVASSTFYCFLERMKWRRVMPRAKHPKKASDEVIEASKKLTLNSRK